MTRLHDHPGDARLPERIAARFWGVVDKDGPIPEQRPDLGPCWIWKGKRDTKDGYGKFDYRDPAGKRIHVRAHRYAFDLSGGNLGSLYACHRCDNPACVNPGHLFAGMQLENRRDCKAKGRTATGRASGPALRSKLTDDDIRAIRLRSANGEHARSIMVDFAIGRTQVSRIATGARWSHVV